MKKYIYLILGACFFSCENSKQTKIIILSKASANYVNWLSDPYINIINAYDCTNLDSILMLADGIVLTGGEDINPLMYGDSSNLQLCEKMDFRRDTIEKILFDFSLSEQIPFIGVCRGMQMMNVAYGGTLYGDLPTEIGELVTHRNNGEVMHDIVVARNNHAYTTMIFPQDPNTLFRDTIFSVNSWHHQGLKDIPEGIKVIATSCDGLPEAIAMDKYIHPFMIAVQFHPERLGKDNAIHKNMRARFFDEIYDPGFY
jgi:putative glutamine amidotransferase